MSDIVHPSPDPRASHTVTGLVDDLAPVTPVRLAREVALALALQVGAVLATASMLGAGPAALERLGDPAFLGLLAALGGGAVAAVFAMARLAVPGRVVDAAPRLLVAALPVLLSAFVVLASPWGGTWKGAMAVLVEGIGCTRLTVMVAGPAWVAGLLVLRRLAALDPFATGLFASSSALLWAALAVQMACPSCDSWHLAMSHYLPIVVAAWAAAVVSVPVLRGAGGSGKPVARDPSRP